MEITPSSLSIVQFNTNSTRHYTNPFEKPPSMLSERTPTATSVPFGHTPNSDFFDFLCVKVEGKYMYDGYLTSVGGSMHNISFHRLIVSMQYK